MRNFIEIVESAGKIAPALSKYRITFGTKAQFGLQRITIDAKNERDARRQAKDWLVASGYASGGYRIQLVELL